MNKTLILILGLLLSLGLLNAGDYIIGTGTSTQNYVPLYGYVNYNWSKFFYSAAEMQASGFTTVQPITKIAFELGNNLSGYVTDDQRVYMRAWYDYEYVSTNVNYPGTASFAHVFTGSVTWNGPGWVEITLDTPYNYDPQWGIEILWENRDGSRLAGPPNFRYTSTENYTAVQHTGSSSSFPTTNGSRRRDRRPNIWFITPATEAPNPAVAVTPTHAATDVAINTSLRWNHGGGSPTGYRLWLGSDNPPSNIVSAQLLTTNSFTPEDYLEYGTEYYWRIVPFNEFGPAFDCPVWTFTTLPDPSIAEFPYLEDFDGTFPPTGWTHHSGQLVDPIVLGGPTSSQWQQDDWLNIPSTDKAARINIWGPISGYLISPMLNIPSDDYALEFDVAILRYNQSPDGTPPNYTNPDDQFAILIGDGFSWSTANIVREYNNAGSEYVLNDIPVTGQRVSIPLAGHTGRIRVAIFAGSTISNDDNDFMVNNFRVGIPAQVLPSPEPAIALDPLSGFPVLSWEALPGASMYHIYKSNDPEAGYLLLDSIDGTSYILDQTEAKAFFKITAE